MPLYEYRCLGECGMRFDRIVSASAKGILCPKCQGVTERLISQVNFVIAAQPFWKPEDDDFSNTDGWGDQSVT